jgi:hypothetical protein
MRDKGPQLRRDLLTPLAAEQGLSYDSEVISPGRSPEQNAYHFVSIGADILVALCDRGAFPSADRTTSRRGAKLLSKSLTGPGARRAAVFLGRVFTVLMHDAVRPPNPDIAHVAPLILGLIDEHYPLDRDALDLVQECRVEFRVMETHEVRGEVRAGYGVMTAYHMALIDPSSTASGNPDDDPELVAIQTDRAARYLRAMAGLEAIRMTIGDEEYAAISDKLFHPDSHEFDAYTHASGEAAFWNHLAEEWDKYAEMALTPAPRQTALPDPAAQALRERIEELLGAENPTPLPEPAAEIAGRLAADVTDNRVDWNLALDALIMGYRCRQAEVERGDWNSFDPDYAAKLKEMSADDPEMAVLAGAISVEEGLPAAFGPSDETWDAVCTWAVTEALDRSWGRHQLKLEDGDGPTLSQSEVEHAFGLGYGLALSQSAVSGSAT